MLAFAPDLPLTTPEVLSEVSAVPTSRGYKSPPTGVTTDTAALTDQSQGAALMLRLDGTTRTLAGSALALWELLSGTWTDVSRGTAYTAGTTRWRYAQFGNTSLAITKVTQLQFSNSGAFADVTAAPKAAFMDANQGFLVLGNTDDTGVSGLTTAFGDQPHRWWTSALFSPTTPWQPNVATQATSGLLIDTEGPITGMKHLGAQMVAFKAKSMYVGDFVGPPVVLDFNLVADDVGCASNEAVAAANYSLYFPGDDDFYVFDGSRPQRIGAAIREWFFARLNRTYISTIQALHDRTSNLIFWFYPTTSAALDSVVVYHYPTGRWGAFSLTITDVLRAVTSAITYDDLGGMFATYDDMPNIAYDSPFWTAASPVLAYFDAADTLKSLSGISTAMTMTTGWIGAEELVSLCTRVRPKFRTKPSGGTITHSHVMDLAGTVESEAPNSINGDRFDVLASGRYHRFATSFVGTTEIEAFAPSLVPVSEE